jgi:sugar lactone lactonase YvrE
VRRLLAGTLLAAILGASPAAANSVASIVVADNGDVYFSDYVRDKVWKLDADGALSASLSNVHSYHLVRDAAGTIYGEHRSPRGGDPTIWRLKADGSRDEAFRGTRHGATSSYRGTLFTIDPQGGLLYLRDCQLVRLGDDGGLVPLTRHRCARFAWTDHALIYGHLHGSMAWAPDGTLYFSDGRSIRRVAPDGAVTTLSGKPTSLFGDPKAGEERFDMLMGLAVDSDGILYAADGRRRAILRFEPGRKPTVVARLGMFWSPIGLATFGNDVYVLVNLRFPTPGFLSGAFGNPTLQKISGNGRIQTIAAVKNSKP